MHWWDGARPGLVAGECAARLAARNITCGQAFQGGFRAQVHSQAGPGSSSPLSCDPPSTSPSPFSPDLAHVPLGVLGRRGFPLESAVTHMCREAGGRVDQCVFPGPGSGCCLTRWTAVDWRSWLTAFSCLGMSTLVCALHCDGSPLRMQMVVLQAARRRKERTYLELVGPRYRARLYSPWKWVT